MNKQGIFFLMSGLLLLFVYIFFQVGMNKNENTVKIIKKPSPVVVIGKTPINIEIVSSKEEMAKGLGGRDNLASGSGMLFDFGGKTMPRFWMKDMKFPLDFIWISDLKVADLTENVSHLDQQIIYSPKIQADSVLEVNANFVKNNNIRIGDKIVIR